MKALALLLAFSGAASAADVDASSGAGAGYSWTRAVPRTGSASADAAMRAWSDAQLAAAPWPARQDCQREDENGAELN